MSAFQCSDLHIAYLTIAWTRQRRALGVTVMSEDQRLVARILKAENLRSVTHRYAHRPEYTRPCPSCGEIVCSPLGDERTMCPFAHVNIPHDADRIGVAFDPVIVIKQAQCLEYQSNEHPAWETSRAKEIIESIISAAIASLPGYEAAPWGIS